MHESEIIMQTKLNNILSNNNLLPILDNEITLGELLESIKKLKNKKAFF